MSCPADLFDSVRAVRRVVSVWVVGGSGAIVHHHRCSNASAMTERSGPAGRSDPPRYLRTGFAVEVRIEQLDGLSRSCRRSPTVSKFRLRMVFTLTGQVVKRCFSPCAPPRSLCRHTTAIMITRFLTEVRVAFNPFSPRSKPARLFLSLIPADARANGMSVQSKLLPRTSKEAATLGVKFSMCPHPQKRISRRMPVDVAQP